MRNPVFVRQLTDEEQHALKEATSADNAFTQRRAQILRLSSEAVKAAEIAHGLGLSQQTVLNALHDFHKEGLASLTPKPRGPQDPERIFDEDKREALMEIAHQSPRAFSKPRSIWSLEALAEVAFEEGLTQEQVSHETIRQAILAMGVSWQRAKHWIESPDPQYTLKKTARSPN